MKISVDDIPTKTDMSDAILIKEPWAQIVQKSTYHMELP